MRVAALVINALVNELVLSYSFMPDHGPDQSSTVGRLSSRAQVSDRIRLVPGDEDITCKVTR